MAWASRLLISTAVLVTILAVNCNPEVDCLIEMKNSLIDNHNVLQSWDPSSPDPCSWAFISCNAENSVVRLELGNAGLSGSIAPQIPVLKNLLSLEAPNNSLSGEIPPGVGDIKSLISLDLQQNVLTGVIPGALGSLKSLKFMRLNSNKLSGEIPPEVMELAFVGNLILMNVSDNSLYGRTHRANSTGLVTTTIIQDPQAEA